MMTNAVSDFRAALVGEIDFLGRCESRDDETPRSNWQTARRRTYPPTRRTVRAARMLLAGRERRRELFRRARQSVEGETAAQRLLPLLEDVARGHDEWLYAVSNGSPASMQLASSGYGSNMDKLLWYLPPKHPQPNDAANGQTDNPKDKTKKLPRDERTRLAIRYVNTHRKKVRFGKAQPTDLRDLVAEFAGKWGTTEVERIYRALQPDRHGGWLNDD